MRPQRDLSGLIRFLARDDWRASFEGVIGEHFGPAIQAFDLEYEKIGAALGVGWDTTLWGVAFEDFLGREIEPDGRNFIEEYLRRRGWNETAPTKAYLRGLRNSIMSLYEVSAIVPGAVFSCARPDPRRRTRSGQRADRNPDAHGMGPDRRPHRGPRPKAHPGRRPPRLSLSGLGAADGRPATGCRPTR